MDYIEKIIIKSSDTNIKIDEPFPITVEYFEEKYLNIDGQTGIIIITFILKPLAKGVIDVIGADIYKKVRDFLNKQITKNNKSSIKFEMKYAGGFSAKFSADKIDIKTVNTVFDSFAQQMNKIDFNNLLKSDKNQIDFSYSNDSWKEVKNEDSEDYWKNKLDEINESDLDME